MSKKRKPARLQKKQEWYEYNEENSYNKEMKTIYGIPVSFILITVILIAVFALILIFMGPTTESGMAYNGEFHLNG